MDKFSIIEVASRFQGHQRGWVSLALEIEAFWLDRYFDLSTDLKKMYSVHSSASKMILSAPRIY